MRSTFRACERKFWLRFFESWDLPRPSVHLHAGQAFAKGLEVTRKAWFLGETRDPDEAIARGWQALIEEYGDFVDEAVPNKSAHRMGEALISYFDQYPLETDLIQPAMFHGRPAVEFRFALPLPILNPSTGDPILYTGRFDMLGLANGQLFVVDEKTTGSLGQYWSRRYELSAQFTGYCWAAKEYGYPVVGAMIRGIGILSKEIKHAEMPLWRHDFLIAEWYEALLADVKRMIEAWKAMEEQSPWSVWQPDFADACGAFGGCQFLPVCEIAPQSREKLLDINFAKRVWDPLGGAAED